MKYTGPIDQNAGLPTDAAVVRLEFERRLARAGADELYLTLEQACHRFGVSRGTLWKWRKLRGLKQSKVGKCTFFRVADIRSVIEGGFSR